METKTTVLVDATSENVAIALEKIKTFAEANGYQIIGKLEAKKESLVSRILSAGTGGLQFDSLRKKKVLRNYLTRLNKKAGMRIVNQFLNYLYKVVYKSEECPRIDYSAKELAIKAARKKWRETMKESDKLRLAYKTEKGDFYKKQVAAKAA